MEGSGQEVENHYKVVMIVVYNHVGRLTYEGKVDRKSLWWTGGYL